MKTKRKFIPKNWDKEFLLCSPNDLKKLFLNVHEQLLIIWKLRNPSIDNVFDIEESAFYIESEISHKMHVLGMTHTKREKESWKTDKEIIESYTNHPLWNVEKNNDRTV